MRQKMAAADGRVVDLSNLERQRKINVSPVDEVWGVDGGSAKLDAMGIKTVLDLADSDIRLSVNILMSCSKERCVNCAVNPVCNWKSLHRQAGNYLFPLVWRRITDYPSMRQPI